MKKILLIISAALIFASCNNSQQEIDNLNATIDTLELNIIHRDNTVNDFFDSFNQIQENLDKIKEKENILTISTDLNPEPNATEQERIHQDIELINSLLENNRQTIAKLKSRLKSSNIKIVELQKTVEKLQKMILDKDAEIKSLYEHLENLNIKIVGLNSNIDSLNIESENKDIVIGLKDDEINTAFYVYGTKKELLEHQVITKEGGFVGLGKILKLQRDFNKDYFTQVNIREVNKIELYTKKAKLITSHPSNSYKFEMNGETVASIIITDSKAFWETSKYLVIVVE